jgi:hypothetical protein
MRPARGASGIAHRQTALSGHGLTSLLIISGMTRAWHDKLDCD